MSVNCHPAAAPSAGSARDGATSSASLGGWHAGAAYLYLLNVRPSSLAWEYLRRNPAYQDDWNRRGQAANGAERWGLAVFEAPQLDARVARPLWLSQSGAAVWLAIDTEVATPDSRGFSLWSAAGRKAMWHDGRSLLCGLRAGARAAQFLLPLELHDGTAFAYVLRAGPAAGPSLRAIRQCEALLQSGCVLPAPAVRVDRVAIAHMRSLQALDGVASGASHRAVASVLFGSARVAHDWHADGELRAQTRHLIRRGRVLMQGGYRGLVTAAPRSASRCAHARPRR